MSRRSTMRSSVWWAGMGIGLALAAVVNPVGTAGADGPGWSNTRTLDCGAAGVVDAVLPPAGFGTAFHLVDSTAVITPKWVEVRFPGTTDFVVTLAKPGIDHTVADTIECRYTDPAGLEVHFVGIVTSAA